MNDVFGKVRLAVCVGSIADIEAAIEAGVDRLELSSALELGGLTPSNGCVKQALDISSKPIVVMLRPEGGRLLLQPP
jgi:copper homeostasis protein